MLTYTSHINHIVIADDDSDDTYLFREAITQLKETLTVSVVENGEKLIHFLDRNIPDLIFLDLNMPVMNGQECLQAIRSDQKLEAVPVIIYSTSSNPLFIEQCYAYGANYYVVKPYSFTTITMLIEKILKMDWTTLTVPAREKFLLEV